jgi:hypothetical protein
MDDRAMAPLSEPERRDFGKIGEDRYQVRLADSHGAVAGRSMPQSLLARYD